MKLKPGDVIRAGGSDLIVAKILRIDDSLDEQVAMYELIYLEDPPHGTAILCMDTPDTDVLKEISIEEITHVNGERYESKNW